MQCALCGCSGPPRPSKSTFLTHGLLGTCPHYQYPHGGSWSRERTEAGDRAEAEAKQRCQGWVGSLARQGSGRAQSSDCAAPARQNPHEKTER